MSKSLTALNKIVSKRSILTYEQLCITKFNAIEITDDKYRFLNNRKSMLLPMDTFDTVDRSRYKSYCKSPKIVSDMIIQPYAPNLVGFSSYYDNVDIFCESGCVYNKFGSVYCIVLIDITNTSNVIVMNKYKHDNEFVRYVIKSYLDNLCTFDQLIIGNPFDYIRGIIK